MIKTTIRINQSHINKGMRGMPEVCPVALAAQDALKPFDINRISMGIDTLRLHSNAYGWKEDYKGFHVPIEVANKICESDRNAVRQAIADAIIVMKGESVRQMLDRFLDEFED